MVLTMIRGDAHLYPIRTEESYLLHTGFTSDNRQVLMGLYCPDIVAIFFEQNGSLLEAQKRRLSFLKPDEGVYDIYDPRITDELLSWQTELGFQPGTIRVKRFFVWDNPEFSSDLPWMRNGIGIQDYPDHFAEILGDPNALEEEKEALQKSLEPWEADGQFVLWWGNDYWLNREGEFVSS
jgi:hypothetical protein